MLDIFFMLTKPRPRAAPRRPEVQQT
jgi:hypothetical protein